MQTTVISLLLALAACTPPVDEPSAKRAPEGACEVTGVIPEGMTADDICGALRQGFVEAGGASDARVSVAILSPHSAEVELDAAGKPVALRLDVMDRTLAATHFRDHGAALARWAARPE